MTTLQELLGKILTSRINTEKANGTLDADKENLSQTLDIFLAGDKITTDQYAGFTELIDPTTTDSESSDFTTASDTDSNKTA
jgi:hypothetical protein